MLILTHVVYAIVTIYCSEEKHVIFFQKVRYMLKVKICTYSFNHKIYNTKKKENLIQCFISTASLEIID